MKDIQDIEVLRSTIKMIITTEMNYIASHHDGDMVRNAKGRMLAMVNQQFDARKPDKKR